MRKFNFHCTHVGMKVEGRDVLPGSTLILNTRPPSHWHRFGKLEEVGDEAVSEKKLEVATPDSAKTQEPQEPEQTGQPKEPAQTGQPKEPAQTGTKEPASSSAKKTSKPGGKA